VLRDWWHEEELERLKVLAAESEIQGFLQQAVQRLRSFRDLAPKQANAKGVQGHFVTAKPGDTSSGRGRRAWR
jgi:hypothetical protein